ncbi:MAG TPA: hypothetical protein VFG88_05225 [Nocardioidaceae bacterium]|jgi:hypothetical protein|nr:hypothetical protein [Nocardioidaceae bacterium]
MDLIAYHTLRSALQQNAAPADGRALTTWMSRWDRDLVDAGFLAVELELTGDPDRLVIGLCQFGHGWDEHEVGQWVQRRWIEALAAPFWEAHCVVVTGDQVELEAATRPGPAAPFTTVHLVAQRCLVPAQGPSRPGPGRPVAGLAVPRRRGMLRRRGPSARHALSRD